MISLHTATAATFLQLMPSLLRLLDKAEAYCREHALPDEAITESRLAKDMWPFSKQVMSTVQYSSRMIAALPSGTAGPDTSTPPGDFAALRAALAKAIAFLKEVDPAELDALGENVFRYDFRTTQRDFTVADFMLSFALPSFHFHLATAYALLRHRGLAIGKADYLGRLRFLPA